MTEPSEPGDLPRRGWWPRWGITVLGLLVLVLTGFTAGLSIQQGAQTRRIAADSQRLSQHVTQTQVEVLCPLLGLFLDSYRPALQPPANRNFYEHAFGELRRMYGVLQCPPRKGSPS